MIFQETKNVSGVSIRNMTNDQLSDAAAIAIAAEAAASGVAIVDLKSIASSDEDVFFEVYSIDTGEYLFSVDNAGLIF